jgi:hypothetical protein
MLCPPSKPIIDLSKYLNFSDIMSMDHECQKSFGIPNPFNNRKHLDEYMGATTKVTSSNKDVYLSEARYDIIFS